MHPLIFKAALCLVALILTPACGLDREQEQNANEVPGVTEDTIRVGSSLALSGHASFLGTQTLQGAQAYIKHINEQGGVHGRQIELISYDDAYDPARCLANTQKLIVEDQVFSLFSYVGTPTTVKALPLIEEAEIPLLGIFTGASDFREPFNRNIINIRASYYQETEAAVTHFVEELGLDEIAVFYQYDAYGLDGLRGTELALKEYDLAPVATGSYTRGTLDIEDGLQSIMESGAEAVVMVGTYDACSRFIQTARERGFEPIFHNVSFVGAEEMARILGPAGDGVIITQVVPPPDSLVSQALLWGVQEFVDLYCRYFPEEDPNMVALEGFINAKVLVEGLKRAGSDLNRESFIQGIQTIQDFSLGIANTLNFGPKDHQGLTRVYFTVLKDGKLELLTDWDKFKQDIETKDKKSGPCPDSGT
ncbi:Extracellular ligand-binding receptor [Desulfonatronospira thiodismutans ASO3-1]|uniref:Extracellular ligand-binding receptor n=1 Tax=Desulfonatronospira thiodismutans ASO3-1 TaxID=555779 RepID=D6SSQ4_9BACT|nr:MULTISPECIES: ABC transporter substrate-binding protein [Desulfonatronospira]EFI33720.1 Extracellular ligand-binding receptor [Desulfonatronospira thiodismutans ASO3-1]RQD73556.1 MAG: hypothetical protein D5S03_12455 [Desulfonatronospira sp. MSAO_Bac3]